MWSTVQGSTHTHPIGWISALNSSPPPECFRLTICSDPNSQIHRLRYTQIGEAHTHTFVVHQWLWLEQLTLSASRPQRPYSSLFRSHPSPVIWICTFWRLVWAFSHHLLAHRSVSCCVFSSHILVIHSRRTFSFVAVCCHSNASQPSECPRLNERERGPLRGSPSNRGAHCAPFREAKVACNTHSSSLSFIPIHIQKSKKNFTGLNRFGFFNDRSLFFSNRPYCFVPSFRAAYIFSSLSLGSRICSNCVCVCVCVLLNCVQLFVHLPRPFFRWYSKILFSLLRLLLLPSKITVFSLSENRRLSSACLQRSN